MNKAKILYLVNFLVLTLITPVRGQEVTVIKFDQLQEMLSRHTDTLNVVNFWATWCGPCVKELPYFENLKKSVSVKKIRVLLVSMDDVKTLDSKVKPFIKRQKIKSETVLLDETDLNIWVDKLVPEWSGALPMTLILNTDKRIRKYIGKPVQQEELKSIINQYKL